RPGHFKGVGQVVHILFDLVKPNTAFFGQKDFQQLQVIKRLVQQENMPIEIVGMPTIRESDGLAMSSRNRRLNESQRFESTLLHKVLTYSKTRLKQQSFNDIRLEVQKMFTDSAELELEYFDIIYPDQFIPADRFREDKTYHAVISAYAGEIRLIDNMQLA
ncbi:pantoate--beta-alanine ligase, partial [Salibacteraceae bacterium]|nr:pantoate--beta-alanine ligase [Salibacteraceae bacterium]